jgi:hypothetical protein
MNAIDPFACGGDAGRESGDAEILALFRAWLEDCRAVDALTDSDEAEWDAVLDHRDRIEEQIAALRGGPIGLAVKTFLFFKPDACWCPSIADIRYSELFDPDGDHHPAGENSFMVSLLRDAAALVPEIGECAAAVVHEDACLIDADVEIGWCRECLEKEPDPKTGRREGVRQRLSTMLDRVAQTSAKTPRGTAIKLRHTAT